VVNCEIIQIRNLQNNPIATATSKLDAPENMGQNLHQQGTITVPHLQ
jgi:hypothetical protein